MWWVVSLLTIVGILLVLLFGPLVIRRTGIADHCRKFLGLGYLHKLALIKLLLRDQPIVFFMGLSGGLFGGLLETSWDSARRQSRRPKKPGTAIACHGTGATISDRVVAERRGGGAGAWLGRGARLAKTQFWNAALVFVPLAIVGHWLGMGPVFVFTCSALACIPLSFRLGQATESLGNRVGPVAGGLLNATFGNAAEMIITIVALNQGLYVLVRTTLVGSIIGQLLLVLGTSLLLAGLKYKNMGFSKPLVQINFALLFIALLAISLPTLRLMGASEGAGTGGSYLAPALAVMLMVIYGFAVLFSLRSQPIEGDKEEDGPKWTTRNGLLVLASATVGIVVISELLVGTVTSFVEATGISQVFLGLILIPIFSNVVDHLVAITVALKNKMDLSLVVSVGSAVQVACLVLPIIVLISFATGQTMGMIFTPLELLVLATGILLMVPVLLDGDSNWLEGAELLTCYFILAAVLWTF